jgi:2-polyprenyl-3-methyl-5-hydroxy-6-metoxy-1,4-benzoquinol methylase
VLKGHDRLAGGPGVFQVVECARCGLAHTDPRPGPDEFDSYYPASYANHRPPGGRPKKSAVDRLRLEAVVRYGPYREILRRPPGRLLDVGCGRGELAETFQRHGWTVAGIEPSDSASRQAVARGIEVHHGTVDDCPWPAESFDAVVLNHSLEHLPAPLEALRHIRALLREDGVVGISVPNFGSWERRLFRQYWFQLDLPRHLQHFDRTTLPALVMQAGLQPVELGTTSMRVDVPASLQYVLFGRLAFQGRWFRAGLWLMLPPLLLLGLVARGDCLNLLAAAAPRDLQASPNV